MSGYKLGARGVGRAVAAALPSQPQASAALSLTLLRPQPSLPSSSRLGSMVRTLSRIPQGALRRLQLHSLKNRVLLLVALTLAYTTYSSLSHSRSTPRSTLLSSRSDSAALEARGDDRFG